jgi:hypothetical protein
MAPPLFHPFDTFCPSIQSAKSTKSVGTINKMKTKIIAISALALGLVSNDARSTPISGNINFDGVATTDTGTLATATAYTSITGTYVVPSEAGNYALVPVNTPVTFMPFSFSALGVTPLWTFTVGATTYSFDATSISVGVKSSGFLDIYGKGIANVTGFASTSGIWSITDTTVGGVSTFVFGASTAVVPDSGSTGLLTVLGLLGMGLGIWASRRIAIL